MQKDCNLLLPAVGTYISEALDHHPVWSRGWAEGENTETKQPSPLHPRWPSGLGCPGPIPELRNPRESSNQSLQKEELGNIKAPVVEQAKARETDS